MSISHEQVLDKLRAEQAALVMPLIGPLIDEWESLDWDELTAEYPGLMRIMKQIIQSMLKD